MEPLLVHINICKKESKLQLNNYMSPISTLLDHIKNEMMFGLGFYISI